MSKLITLIHRIYLSLAEESKLPPVKVGKVVGGKILRYSK